MRRFTKFVITGMLLSASIATATAARLQAQTTQKPRDETAEGIALFGTAFAMFFAGQRYARRLDRAQSASFRSAQDSG